MRTAQTAVIFSLPESAAPTPLWPIEIVAKYPVGTVPDPVPDMRRAGCDRMLSEIREATAVLVFEWSEQPVEGGIEPDEFVKWWASEAGWDYEVGDDPALLQAATAGTDVTFFEPDVNGRPCIPKSPIPG
jgi:hypothetical protein